MAQELQIKQSHQRENQIIEDPLIEEIRMRPRHSLYDRVHEMAEKFATTRIGQFVIERGDRMLRTIEQTAKWSLPQDKMELKMERPLPWIPFLGLIILLRFIRIWVSIAALLIGNAPVSPQDMVYFIQTRRRKLRAIRVQGLKVIRSREIEDNSSTSGHSAAGFLSKFKTLMSSAICRPGQHREPNRRIFVHRAEVNTNQTDVDRQAPKRPRDEDSSDPNLTVNELLNKYANEDSDDDSDFIPNPEDELNDADTTSSGTSSDETETDMNNQEVEKPMIPEEQKNNAPKSFIDTKNDKVTEIDNGNEQIPTPRENGPANGGEIRETEVAPKHNSANNMNHNNKASSTYGHDEPHKISNYENGSTENITKTTKSTFSGLGLTADTIDPPHPTLPEPLSISIPNTSINEDAINLPKTPPTTPISTVNISSSNNPDNESPTETETDTDMNSLITANDNLVVNESTESISSNFESSNLTSASSSEDIFYSPIGSPPEYDNFQECPSFKNSTVTFSDNIDVMTTSNIQSTPTTTEFINYESIAEATAPFRRQMNYGHRHQNYNQTQNQNSQFRQRGRNRR